MFDGKMKALTFSYDDGITQDKRLIEILNKYGLKCTFNLNSGLLGQADLLIREGVTVAHVKPQPCEVRAIYEGHEIAGHTLTHPHLIELDDESVIREVEEDRLALSEIAGYEVVGMAYPGGSRRYDQHTVDLIARNTGMKYARSTTVTHGFDLQPDNLMNFRPTLYQHTEMDLMFELGEQFIGMKPDTPRLFYIWGHSYEFDVYNSWARFEEFCKMISGRSDIFCGTNREVFLSE